MQANVVHKWLPFLCRCIIYTGMMLLACGEVSARYEHVLHLPYRDKIWWVDSFYRNTVSVRDSTRAFAISNGLREAALQAKDRELALEADLFDAYYYFFYTYGSFEQVAERMKRVAAKGKKENCLHIEARALFIVARIYWRYIQNYELGFAYYLQLSRLLDKTGQYDFPDVPKFYFEIGKAYYTFRDYRTAIYYLLKAAGTEETEFNSPSHWAANNNLGLCYQKLRQLDSSDYYFRMALSSEYPRKDSLYHYIIQGNLGYNRYLSGDDNAAMPLLAQDRKHALERKDSGHAAGAAIPLADILIRQNRPADAGSLLAEARQCISASGQTDRLEAWYPVICKYHTASGNIKMAGIYLDSALRFKDHLQEKFSAFQLLRAQQKIDHEQALMRDERYRMQQDLEHSRRNLLIVLFSLMAFLLAYIIFRQRKGYRTRHAMQQEALHLSRQDLDNARVQLSEFAHSLSEKNLEIGRLEERRRTEKLEDVIAELRKSAILTEEDWVRFRQNFDKVHGGYIARLKETYPQLTPAELRLLVLARLKFSTRDMATALGISPNSVRVTWHRLRHKLELPEDATLEVLAASL